MVGPGAGSVSAGAPAWDRSGSALGGKPRSEACNIAQQGVDLVGLKGEIRHGRMPGDDAFGQRLGQVFDGVALWQDAERGRAFKWARASRIRGRTRGRTRGQTRGMTARAVQFGYGTSACERRCIGACTGDRTEADHVQRCPDPCRPGSVARAPVARAPVARAPLVLAPLVRAPVVWAPLVWRRVAPALGCSCQGPCAGPWRGLKRMDVTIDRTWPQRRP